MRAALPASARRIELGHGYGLTQSSCRVQAIARRVPQREVIVRRFAGTRFDCGSKAGFLAANIALGKRQGLIG